MHRVVAALFVSFMLLMVGSVPAALAQDATPDSGLGDLGLPTLDVAVSATAFEGIPSELEAGRYLVTVTASEDTEFGGGVAFVKPEGMTPEEFLAAAAGPPDIAGEEPGGTPELTEATPAASQGGGPAGPPDVFFDFTFAGGIYAPPGQQAQIVLDLAPGEWVAWGDDPTAPQEPVIFSVTGEMPGNLTEPDATATITMGEYVIDVTEGELTTGQQLVKIENIGAQPHFVFVSKGPDGMTEDDIAAILEADMTGTPAATDINPEEDLVDIVGTGTQSTDTAIWVSMDLDPGTYLMICFFPDRADGMPHAIHGMYSVVEVSE